MLSKKRRKETSESGLRDLIRQSSRALAATESVVARSSGFQAAKSLGWMGRMMMWGGMGWLALEGYLLCF